MKTLMNGLRSSVIAVALLPLLAMGVGMPDYYEVEDVPMPAGVEPACGGLDFLPDGRVAAVFDHGELCIYDPVEEKWSVFAEGFHTPMGVIAVSEREFIVVQRPELTRVTDTDGDGVADVYAPISDGWGLSGNYHEFAFGVVQDKEGNFYVPLGSGSAVGVPRFEVRGTFNPSGRLATGGHYSVVPYRGWVVKITPEGELEPFAAGFRQPNGIGLDPEGELLVTDNQGDWIGTTPLHHIKSGGFYGHPAPLVWRDPPIRANSVLEFNRLRTWPVVQFPHAILANSAGQPVFDLTEGKFGPYEGQLFISEYVTPRLLRVMLEEVAGEWQGAATTFFDGAPLRLANVRLGFAPDGSLWVGQSERKLGWPGTKGMQRISWNGRTPFDVKTMKLTSTGFEFTFTKPAERTVAKNPENYPASRYYFVYQAEYGSPRTDIHEVNVSDLQVSDDGLRATLALDILVPGYLYEFNLDALRSTEGESMANPLIVYTLNRLLDGRSAVLPRPPPTGGVEGSGKDKPEGAIKRKPPADSK